MGGLGWIFVALGCGAAVAGAAEVTPLPPPVGTGIERGVVAVRCRSPVDGYVSDARAAILDVGTPTADVLLTTAHALLPDAAETRRRCYLIVNGDEQTIAEVWNAGGNLSGPEQDWAVMLTRRISGDVSRWHAANVTGEWLANAAADRVPVRLVLRYAGVLQTDCHLEPRTQNPALLLAHSCQTYEGLSGSPLVVAVEGEPAPILIGVHVGVLAWLARPRIQFVHVARAVDPDVVAAIRAATERAALPVALPPQGRRVAAR